MSRVPVAPLVVLVAAVLVGGLSIAAVGLTRTEGPRPRPSPVVVPADSPSVTLARWDAARAAAYASGDLATLRGLYVDGSGTGRRDVRLLRRYVARGLVVRGMRTQVLGLVVVREDAGHLTLRVTDRLSGAWAVGRGHRVALPASVPRTRRVTLVPGGPGEQGWRVREVSTLGR